MEEEKNKEIGNRLKAARKAAGFLSATEAATALGMNYRTYAGHENGNRGISRNTLELYAKRFGVTTDWLLSGRKDAVGNRYKRKIDEKLSFIMKATGWRQADLAEKLSVTQACVSRWFSGADPRGEHRDKITEIYNAITGKSEITRNTESLSKSYVPLMGYVGAGAKIKPDFGEMPPDGLGVIEIPFPMPADMVAFRVRGDLMLPVYREGHIIIVYRDQTKPLEAFYGEEAVVQTSDRRRFIKTIMRGAEGVNLISWNARPIENVTLEWIGEIFAVLPRQTLRHVDKNVGYRAS
ncbi:helix-turn-helix transcriptional regulator [Bartonella sp. W8098]|uniref:XRE family transcriptional regulator n=1 Tax=Bartonella TaxID=773 RepID=UPI0018DB5A5B|nr:MULTISPECIES: XRE family transcriptional regulator [Bartonella]MBH9987564.1 helix-turn-helix transcriptional regulator [Bartonella apis]MBI0171428.1 helix-turn-helix transcriptional regulator [Bartonella sp. W8151]